MDNSLKNIAKEDSLDKVTIKVKVEDEGYHDIVIDWSDGSCPYKDQQVINQLASIIGIPVEYIRLAILVYAPHNHFDLGNIKNKSFDPRFWGAYADEPDEYEPTLMPRGLTRENCLGRLNDGDCFVMRPDLNWEYDGCFNLRLWLYSLDSEFYNENNCAQYYCHYSNTRTFLDRKVSVIKNTELNNILRAMHAELPPPVDAASIRQNNLRRWEILKELDVASFFRYQQCRASHAQYNRHGSPYSRTRG